MNVHVRQPTFAPPPAVARLGDDAQSSAIISIIVPTINEAANLPELVRRISAAMAGRSYEVLVIDDTSQDDTVEVCRQLAKHVPLRLCVRESRAGGLSGAVLHGFAMARGEILVVMDADLQHPPEALPSIIAPLLAGEADFVLGSRRANGGRITSTWGRLRRINSWVARQLAAPLVGRVRDPMSGFFALRCASWQRAQSLAPIGYKIALELLCKCRFDRIVEVPIEFATRAGGHSKLTVAQQVNYLRHLVRLYRSRILNALPFRAGNSRDVRQVSIPAGTEPISTQAA